MFEHGKALLRKEFDHVFEEFEHMDLVGFNEGGDSCEIEIKVADYDFYKEFKKESKLAKHGMYLCEFGRKDGFYFCPTRYYFMVLSNFTVRALKYLNQKMLPYGLIEYNSLKDRVLIIKKSERLTEQKWDGLLPECRGRDYRHKREVSI